MKSSQRDYMRYLLRAIGNEPEEIIKAYADAEKKHLVRRSSNGNKLSPEQYARALFLDGLNKNWIFEGKPGFFHNDN